MPMIIARRRMRALLTAGGARGLCAVICLLAGAAGVLSASPAALSAEDPAHPVATVIELNGAIGPAMSDYVDHALLDASASHSAVIVLQIDTPGGLETSMRDIVKTILASPVPVVAYVAPSGARAASAGTYILYACHLAAMAPATNLGAATPISLGGEEPRTPTPPTTPTNPANPANPAPSGPTATPAPGGHGGSSGNAPRAQPGSTSPATAPAGSATPPPEGTPELTTASERKAVNDAVAYIRSLAQLRGRNADWAERAVRGAASLSAEDALQQHVVELIARDVPDLLRQLNGRRVQIEGREVVMHTADLPVQRVMPDWRTRLLLVLSHPTIAYGLLLAGIWGLLLEGYHPGAALPGVVGALCLLLALYALQLLAVNFAGLALMLLGVGLIITEFFMPTYGSLGVGGLAAFVIGSIILFAGEGAGLHVALPVIAGFAIVGAFVIGATVALATRARRKPVTTGAEAMIGAAVEIVDGSRDPVLVRYGGELWNAHASAPVRTGEWASIVKVHGLTLWIEPRHESPPNSR
jgi:membrane-bound serine protease (ClpP class)